MKKQRHSQWQPPAHNSGEGAEHLDSAPSFRLKETLLDSCDSLPVKGFTYRVPDDNRFSNFSNWVVLDVEGQWVHIINQTLTTATSYTKSKWMFCAAHRLIKRLDNPRVDVELIRKALHGDLESVRACSIVLETGNYETKGGS